ncbi:AI-2E family transporter [Marinicauda salina]|uniref:AI-2E family transporter n=1 Tax=Marinicauda salina TaxID=2135793 RepID=A0A2U2BVB2_9PROT|nr:AI-2E family transporter [Marinicauda salina]PWE17966.1 AI-2E family transporter [Marinicauda salina]
MTDGPNPHDANHAQRQALQRSFILILALVVSAVFLWMIRSFLGALFLAAVLTIFLMPLQDRLARLFRGGRKAAAAVVLLIAVLIAGLPLLAVFALVVDQAVEVSQILIPWIQDQVAAVRAEGLEGLPDWLPFREALAPYQAELTSQIGQFASNLGGLLVSGLRRATGGTLGFVLNTVVVLFALFLFLTRGEQMSRRAINLLPMTADDREMLAERTLSTIRATVKGTFVIALIQGVLTGAALAIAGVPGSAFWGTLAGLLAIIPGVGPPLVWAPAGIWLIAEGQTVAGVAVLVWGAAVVGVLDNILRPVLVGKDAKMSDLMVLLSTLGGLMLFGAIGIVIGPVIAALFTSVWYIYAQSYAPLLAEPGKRADEDGDS